MEILLPGSLGALAILGLRYYWSKGLKKNNSIIWRLPEECRQVVLTFDDGPNHRFTPQILHILRKKQVRAHFFFIGKNVEKYPDIARQAVEEGHIIGNHTYHHNGFYLLSAVQMRKELQECSEVIEEVSGKRPEYFRPPRGIYNRNLLKVTEELGLKLVLWTRSSVDWHPRARVKMIYKRALRRIRGGEILLFHDGGNLLGPDGGNRLPTVRCLPLIIDYIRSMGLEFITLPDALALPTSPQKNVQEKLPGWDTGNWRYNSLLSPPGQIPPQED